MKGFAHTLAAGGLLASAFVSGGCVPYHRAVDPCYPDRYNYTARRELIAAFAPQVQNGHVLDQTLFNYYFDAGSADLNASGRDKLDLLVRTRPSPDPRIYLATARDIGYDPVAADAPERYAAARADLDSKREQTVQRYLKAQVAGRPMQFEIVIHDPTDTGKNAHPMNRELLLHYNSGSGSLTGGAAATTAGQGQGGQSGAGSSSGGSSGSGSSGGGSGGGGSGGGR